MQAIVIFLLVLAPLSWVIAAEPLSVVINEIAWMGTETGYYYEWIELSNNTDQEIDLSGWQIENAKSKNETLTILAAKIPAKGYFLICRKEIGDCNLIESKLSLHNEYSENGKLVLKDTAGNIIDATPEANNKQWPAGDNETEQTMERKDALLSGNDSSNWQTSKESGGTPKTENSFIEIEPEPPAQSSKDSEAGPPACETCGGEPIVYPSNIFINELLPSAEGADAENEWIELFNGDNFAVDVSGWQIRDTIGATKTYVISEGTKISAKGFLVLLRTTTNITLQNSGDTLKLIQPDENIIDTVTYEKAPSPIKGPEQSFNRTSSGWAWSETLTPGETNLIIQPEIPKTDSSETFGEKEEGEEALAKISEQLPKSSNPLVVFLIAIAIAISSGIIVLFLRKRIAGEES